MSFKNCPVLYVDDERPNRVVMRYALRDRFKVITAASGAEALSILEQQPVMVLLADQRMPGMSGVELLQQVLRRFPHVVRVIVTAYSDPESTIAAINKGRVSRFIHKPWTNEELVAVIEECIKSHQQQVQLKAFRSRAQKMDRLAALGVIASSLAHDIRNPLSCVTPNLLFIQEELARLQQEVGEVRRLEFQEMNEALQDATRGVERLTEMTTRILGMVSGHRSRDRSAALAQVIEGVMWFTRTPIQQVARSRVEIEPAAGRILVPVGQLEQVLLNLLINAAQAFHGQSAPQNTITIRAMKEPGRLALEVEDTGCGIEPEIQERIYEPLFSVGKESGTGLGLSICRSLVTAIGGSMELWSEVGVGTRFRVVFPLDALVASRSSGQQVPDSEPD